jgi:hypothetical protein
MLDSSAYMENNKMYYRNWCNHNGATHFNTYVDGKIKLENITIH